MQATLFYTSSGNAYIRSDGSVFSDLTDTQLSNLALSDQANCGGYVDRSDVQTVDGENWVIQIDRTFCDARTFWNPLKGNSNHERSAI